MSKASGDELITEEISSLLIIYEYFLTLRAACSMLSEPSQYGYTVDFSACHTVLQHGLSQHLTKRIKTCLQDILSYTFLGSWYIVIVLHKKIILQVTIKSKDAILYTLPFELASYFLLPY